MTDGTAAARSDGRRCCMSTVRRPAVTTPWDYSWTALAGTVVVAGGGVMIGLLRTTGVGVDALSQPLSLYAATSAAWLFNGGVATVAMGLAVLLITLIRTGRLTLRSVEALALLASAGGLITLMIFPDQHVDGAMTAVGWIHWAASMVAFGALPVAPIALGRRHRRRAGCSPLPGAARVLAIIASFLLLGYLAVSALHLAASWIPVWRFGGAVERGLAATELVAGILLGLWAWRGCASDDAPCRQLDRLSPKSPRGPSRDRRPSGRRNGSRTPDRDMIGAGRGERRAVPVRDARDQVHPG